MADDGGHPGAVPHGLTLAAAWAWRLLVVAAAVVATLWGLAQLRVVVLPVIAALLVASVLGPLAGRLRRRGWRPAPATGVALGGTLLLFVAVIAVLVPLFAGELDGIGDKVTQAVDDAKDWARHEPLDWSEEKIDQVDHDVRAQFSGGGGALSGRLLAGTTVVAEVVVGVLLTLVLSFFLVKDGDEIWAWVLSRVHPDRREVVDASGRGAMETLAGYLKGVALTGLVDATFIGIGLVVLGVPLAFPLAVLTFFAAFFPVVGATTVGALSAVVALVDGGIGRALGVVVLTLAVQQLEAHLIMPLVMRRQVNLHPAVVLVALAAGGVVGGIIGAFLAVPATAVVTRVAHEVRVRTPVPASGA